MFQLFHPKKSVKPRPKKQLPWKTKYALPLLLGCGVLLTLTLTIHLATAKKVAPEKDTSSLATSSASTQAEDSQADQPATAAYTQDAAPEGDGLSMEGNQTRTQEDVTAALNNLRETFPEGAYWNHMGVEDWDEFTVTDTPCQHDIYWDTYCNTYSGGIQDLFPQFQPMEQCLGFAALISDLVFGVDAPVDVFTDYTALRPGDHIRLQQTEHSMIVLTVEDEGITVVECNSDYEHCRISWDRFLSWDELAAYSYEMECITRYGTE